MKTTAIRFLLVPHTKLGKWSIGLIIAMLLLFIAGTSLTNILYQSVPAGGTILKDIAARPALALSMLTGIAAGVLSFVTGLAAILSHKERSLWVFLSTLIGTLLIIFLAGEFISPH